MEVLQELFTQSPFKDLGENELKKIAHTIHLGEFSEGTHLVKQYKMVHRIGFIKSGSAGLVVRDMDGNEITCGFLKKGDLFGETCVFADGTSMVSIVCKEPISGYIQSKEDFLCMIKTYPNLRDFFCRTALNRMLNISQMINGSKVKARLVTTGLPRTHQGIRKSFLYIEKNYMEPLTLDAVARESGMSKYHFSRVFKVEAGRSFGGYLNRKRIEVAKSLIEYQDMNITEACFAVGFNDLSYFSRVFRKLEGITPSSYRKDLLR